jgi:SPASM domain peptide maturase of grasp-with-spasm system
MSVKYFKLFASCIPVKGIKKSLIYDFQRNDVYEITNEFYDNIEFLENIQIDIIQKENKELYNFLMKLVDDEIGFLTSTPKQFPKINPYFETPNIISNAIIILSSEFDYQYIFKSLNQLFCRNILLMVDHKMNINQLKTIIEIAQKYNIHTIEFWFEKKIQFKKLIKKYDIIRKLIFFNQKKQKTFRYLQTDIEFNCYTSFKNYCQNRQNIYYLHLDVYKESLKYNTCLNKKISIDQNGNIKNCPFMNIIYGNIKTNDIISIATSEKFQKMWKINKDKINECKDCEYRHMCKDCRAFTINNTLYNKPIFCSFNPYK